MLLYLNSCCSSTYPPSYPVKYKGLFPRDKTNHLSPFSAEVTIAKQLRWSRGSVLAFGIQVRWFAPSRSRRIFRAKKYSARLPSEGK
jgi:hypothetical protein